MIFRTQDELKRKLDKMTPPDYKVIVEGDGKEAVQIKILAESSFRSGYEQAIKEMKEYFNIKGNGLHARYEE